ncbi:MAG: hypothetical protein ACOCV1_06910, partial [Bacillota bacterium]
IKVVSLEEAKRIGPTEYWNESFFKKYSGLPAKVLYIDDDINKSIVCEMVDNKDKIRVFYYIIKKINMLLLDERLFKL